MNVPNEIDLFNKTEKSYIRKNIIDQKISQGFILLELPDKNYENIIIEYNQKYRKLKIGYMNVGTRSAPKRKKILLYNVKNKK